MKGSWWGVGQVGSPAPSGDREHAVLVHPDDRADRDPLGSFEAGEGPEVGWAEALLGEQGSGLGAFGRVEPIVRLLE
jgi:hypothetical protein